MDTFTEQLVSIKKNSKAKLSYFAIWLLAALLIAVALVFIRLLTGLVVLIIAGIGYGAVWLSAKLNVEYEYIITNGTMDIDKITNKSSRARILTFELSAVTRLEKYNPAVLNNIDKKELVFACNPDDEDTYFMVADKKTKGNAYLVFAPNKRTKEAIKKFAPKFITNSILN